MNVEVAAQVSDAEAKALSQKLNKLYQSSVLRSGEMCWRVRDARLIISMSYGGKEQTVRYTATNDDVVYEPLRLLLGVVKHRHIMQATARPGSAVHGALRAKHIKRIIAPRESNKPA